MLVWYGMASAGHPGLTTQVILNKEMFSSNRSMVSAQQKSEGKVMVIWQIGTHHKDWGKSLKKRKKLKEKKRKNVKRKKKGRNFWKRNERKTCFK